MKVPVEVHTKLKQMIEAMRTERQSWWDHWRELADYFLPRRYVWLLSPNEAQRRASRNIHILDSTGTTAARTLASGMMNGITSPARPWFKLRVNGADEENHELAVWLDEVQRRMLLVMSESNFYNAMAVMYLDLVVFGTAAMLIYEDQKNVIRCFNPALGEYYLGQDFGLQVNRFAREFSLKVDQVVTEFGEENCSDRVKAAWKTGGAAHAQDVKLTHILEPNYPGAGALPDRFAFRETYYETGAPTGLVLRRKGFSEPPGIFARWEVTANDAYGTAPASDALGDVIQLQQETRRKAQAIDKMVSPPVVASLSLAHKPMSMLPNGVTFVSNLAEHGAKPLYTVSPPIQEMMMDIQSIQQRIKVVFYNPLFTDISDLQTVRSATEIDARREEKLILLGSVLERFENEALDPAINRIYSVMQRSGLLPEPPEGFEEASLDIQYVSVLSVAQRAVGVAPIERFLGVIGNLAAIRPDVLNIPDFEELMRGYASGIGVPSKGVKSREAVAADAAKQNELVQSREAAATGTALAKSGELLSKVDVGGGQNAVQALLQ